MTTLNDLFRAALEEFGERPALAHKTRQITYAELATQSDALAAHLRDAGVKRGDRVAFWLPKSINAVITIFAILKLGAAYVPIAEKAPTHRAALIAADCGAVRLICAEEQMDAMVKAGVSADLLLPLTEQIWSQPNICPEWVPVKAEDLAYILYTSGSTGRPKGVAISHAASLNFVRWAMDHFELSHSDRLANLAPLSFDLSIFDLFAGLGAGACVHLFSADQMVIPASLSRYVSENRITIWYSVPSALMHLPRYGQLDKYPMGSLRHVLFAGEVFPPPQLARLMAQLPDARFHNLYGPTETNVVAHHEVERGENGPVPIGRTCADHHFTLIDPQGQQIDDAGEGELWVSGTSLMQGYFGEPEANQNCFAEIAQGRAYRTGDIVRRDDAGLYHFIGRADDMVKVRGYRVEPGEIEYVLAQCDAVQDAAVVAQSDALQGNRLIAFIVANRQVEAAELSAHCAMQLPDYMIPAQFQIQSEALPVNTNGKTDRAKLLGRLQGDRA